MLRISKIRELGNIVDRCLWRRARGGVGGGGDRRGRRRRRASASVCRQRAVLSLPVDSAPLGRRRRATNDTSSNAPPPDERRAGRT